MSETQGRIAGVLPSGAALQGVIDALGTAGFDRSQFGVLANREAIPAGEDSAALAADPKVHTEADTFPETEGAVTGGLIGGLGYLAAAVAGGAVLLTGGGLGIAIAAILAAGGAGGLTGALVAQGFHQTHADLIERQVVAGGVVLWIQPRDDAQAKAAIAELDRAGAQKIVVQDAASGQAIQA